MTSAEQAYLFRHALLRDAAYDLQLPAERALLHVRAAEVLEAVHADELDSAASEIAEHLRIAGSQPGREREYTVRGARHARDNYNHDVALRLYKRQCEIGTPNEVIEARQRLYGILRAHFNDKRGARQQALDLWRVGRRHGELEAVSHALNYLAGLERGARARRLLRRSFLLAKRARAWLPAALAVGNLGASYAGELQHRRAQRLFRYSIRLHRRANNPLGEGFFLSALAGQQRQLGDLAAAYRSAAEGMAILEGLGAKRYLPTSYGHMATVLEALGRLEEAEKVLAAADQVAETIELRHELWKLRVHRAMVALERREPAQALAHWGTVVPMLVEAGEAHELEVARRDLRVAGERLNLLPPQAWV
ncbi:MAG: hypothetical protein IT464_08145 [Planctomycetes bacterium]|nr:hypothetical protein [Planctomycetota bacterium]